MASKNRTKNAWNAFALSNDSAENVADAVRNHWAAKSAGPAVKTFDTEFPALPGTVTNEPAEKIGNWISPADLNDALGWGEHPISAESGQNNATNHSESASEDSWDATDSSSNATTEQVAKRLVASWPDDTSLDTPDSSSPVPEWVDPTPPKTAAQLQKEQVDAACFGWPWTGVPDKLVTLAPYHMNGHPAMGPLKLPKVDQKSLLFTCLLKDYDMGFELLKHVFLHHSSAWQLAATCQEAWDAVCEKVDIWDLTNGHFNNCDKEVSKENTNPLQAGSVSAHLVITPMRRPEGPASYVEQVRNLRLLKLSVLNFGHSLRNIYFHRVPFISINNLSLLIPQMAKLEILGIYNCRLMHLATGLKLLELLKVDRLKGKENSVALDWYPNYHLGPETGAVGTYGVCWDNLNLDTCVGIWSIVKRLVTNAREQGIDLESPHTMFRKWLEKTPCWKVGATLNSFFYPGASHLEIAAMVQYRFSHGNPKWFASSMKYKWDLAELSRDFWCRTCKSVQMGIFFPGWRGVELSSDRQQQRSLPACYGCRLTFLLRRDTDHYKVEKRRIIKTWLMIDDKTWNTDNLRKSIEDYELLGIEELAANLDEKRKKHMTLSPKNPDPYDRETQERQVPYTDHECSGKQGGRWRSPDVNEWKNEEFAYINNPKEWSMCFSRFHEKYEGHGTFW